jgi:hypothetical protein
MSGDKEDGGDGAEARALVSKMFEYLGISRLPSRDLDTEDN